MIFLMLVAFAYWRMPSSRIVHAGWATALLSLSLFYLVRWKPASAEKVEQTLWAEVADWYASSPSRSAVIASNTNWFWVTIGLDPYATSSALRCKHDDPHQELQSVLPGTIFLWACDATLGADPSEPADLTDFKIVRRWKAERDRMHYTILALERERSQNVRSR
jgi:hypothetical protein